MSDMPPAARKYRPPMSLICVTRDRATYEQVNATVKGYAAVRNLRPASIDPLKGYAAPRNQPFQVKRQVRASV